MKKKQMLIDWTFDSTFITLKMYSYQQIVFKPRQDNISPKTFNTIIGLLLVEAIYEHGTCKHGQATYVTKTTSCWLAITNLHTYVPSVGSGDTYATTVLSHEKS